MSAAIDCRTCPGAGRDLFACLLREQRGRLIKAAVQHAYGPRESLFHAGTPALAVYCVRAGRLKLFRRLRLGDEVVVGVRGPGDLVGLRGVLAGIPYATTATTLDAAVVCTIPGEVFLGLVRQNPSMGFRLLARLTRESRLLEDQLVERTHTAVGKRTARFLLQQLQGEADASTPARVGPAVSREEMAHLIGTTPETLSRILHGLAAKGILQVERREIRVLDPSALQRIAD